MSGASADHAHITPTAAVAGSAMRLKNCVGAVGAVDHAVSTLLSDAPSSGSSAWPSTLVVATGVLAGRPRPIGDRVAALVNAPISRMRAFAPAGVWIVAYAAALAAAGVRTATSYMPIRLPQRDREGDLQRVRVRERALREREHVVHIPGRGRVEERGLLRLLRAGRGERLVDGRLIPRPGRERHGALRARQAVERDLVRERGRRRRF